MSQILRASGGSAEIHELSKESKIAEEQVAYAVGKRFVVQYRVSCVDEAVCPACGSSSCQTKSLHTYSFFTMYTADKASAQVAASLAGSIAFSACEEHTAEMQKRARKI